MTTTEIIIFNTITNGADGPVNKSTAVHRALELAAEKIYSHQEISDILLGVLDDIDENGDFPSNEFNRV